VVGRRVEVGGGREEGGGREFRGREEVKKKISTGKEDVHPQNRLNRLILKWCVGGCWFTPAVVDDPQLSYYPISSW
jgi:hypothetical protein